MIGYFFSGCLFWGTGAFALYAVRPKSKLNNMTVENVPDSICPVIASVIVAVILLCTLPMSLSPYWNGEIPDHRDQYERLAESFLNGRLDFSYDDTDPELAEMENPYDPAMRAAEGVSFHFDHAFYDGRYYMYFGAVPVLFLFLPFRAVTGASLTTYHATQIFVSLLIIGTFLLFYFLAETFFSKMSVAVWLSLSSAFSMMSVWYFAGAPALYCTAISSAICMEVWSLFFFSKAVWGGKDERSRLHSGMWGSLFGALAFGCRPPVALANLLAVPLLIYYIRGSKLPPKALFWQILAVSLPYAAAGLLLMEYNYVRFENPFEFGQTYQLTISDMRNSKSILSQPTQIVNKLMQNFILFDADTSSSGRAFPWVRHNAILVNFPVYILAYICLLLKKTRQSLKKSKIRGFTAVLFVLPFLIALSQIAFSPDILERYHSDIYWLMGLLSFLAFGFCLQNAPESCRKNLGFLLSVLAAAIIFKCFLLWLVPYDCNFTQVFPEYLEKIEKTLSFGFR